MPIFRHDNDLHYFAHVPKCGGSSVEIYLARRFGPLAFLNHFFYNLPDIERWSKSSPQHMDAQNFENLFPKDWIKSSFAIVRDPLTRVVSAYNHQSIKSKTVPRGQTIHDWFDAYLNASRKDAYLYDNHLRPQSDIVPLDATVFKLENGLEQVIDYIDNLTGNTNWPRQMVHRNKRNVASPDHYMAQWITPDFVDLVYTVYEDDYARFDYPKSSRKQLVSFLPKPANDAVTPSESKKVKSSQ